MRLIDADALKLDIACVYGSNPNYLRWLNSAPTVEAVPVIRCKDCIKCGTDDCAMHFEADDKVYQWNCADDYCSWAERKDNG